MKKKIFQILWLLLIAGFFFPFLVVAAQNNERKLEISYPQIPGEIVPKYVSVGLPDYVKYIFRFATAIIGFIIFGVLVYNGIQYLTSSGQPTKMSEAKKGILSAFLGAIILLSSVLIFNTINPHIIDLELTEPEQIAPLLGDGVYICNYNANVGGDINNLLYGNLEQRIEAAKNLKRAMGDPNSDKGCRRLLSSTPLKDLEIKSQKEFTVFIMPRLDTEKEECLKPENLEEKCWLWEYGVILQEDSDPLNGNKKCFLFPEPGYVLSEGGQIMTVYKSPVTYQLRLPFNIRSAVVFKKPSFEVPELAKGVTLYEGKAFNKIGEEDNDNDQRQTLFRFSPFWQILKVLPQKVLAQAQGAQLGEASFRPSGLDEVKIVSPEELKDVNAKKEDLDKDMKGLHHNTRSISFDPPWAQGGGFLAILLGEGDCGNAPGGCHIEKYKRCEVRTQADGDLSRSRIGQCGYCTLNKLGLASCYPCLEKVYVIKGIRQ